MLISFSADAHCAAAQYGQHMPGLRVPRPTVADVGDILLAALFVASAEIDVWARGTIEGPRVTNGILLAFVAPPLALRRRWPSLAITLTSVAIVVQGVVTGAAPSGFLYAGPILIGSYSLGAHAPVSRRSLAALVTLIFSYGLVTMYWTGQQGIVATDVVWFFAPEVPWVVGIAMRRRRHRADLVAEAARGERAREQERLAALEQERSRMARELHDILAHSVSVMGVQAGAAEEVLSRDPERARPVLQSIQQTSRDAIAELRRLLGMLRAEELESELEPQPRLDQLAVLVARMRDAGLPVELHVDGDAHPLAPGVELTAYRVVQEALTNALKHSRPSRVEVEVGYRASLLEVRVRNDGVSRSVNGKSHGHGLTGMNERVLLYGGRLETGTADADTFEVRVQLPLHATLT
jgi:signal transduction histidine kinase